ncbi:MAG: hypothetical protein NUV75_01975 [Gallionella sp.]|nr:hypothetical protein [Gallionella sp.]
MLAGALEIQMFASLARLSKDMNEAKSIVSRTSRSIESAAAMATRALGALGIGFGVIGFGRFIKGIIDSQDELSKLSQKLNISVEQLAGLRHAADLAGVSGEALTKGFKSLSSQMFDASTGLLESKRNFGLLGIEVKNTDGTLRGTQAVMLQVADKFAGMRDGAAKSALAVKLFGKAGLDMIPMLNEGSAAIAAMIAEGQRLNPVTAESAKQAETFNDNMDRVGKTLKGGFIEAMNTAMPWISDISVAMARAAKDAGFWTAALVGLGGAITHIFGLSDLQKAKERIGEIDKALSMARKQLEAGSLSPPGASDSAFSFLIPDVKLTDAALASIRKVVTTLEAEKAKLVAANADPKAPAKALATLGIPDEDTLKKAGVEAARYRKMDADGWVKHIEAMTEEYENELKMMRELDADENKERKSARATNLAGEIAMYEAIVQADFEATKAIAEAEIAAAKQVDDVQKRLNEERQREFMDLFRTVEGTGKQVWTILTAGGEGMAKSVGKAIKASIWDLLYQMTLRKWTISIGATLSGTASSASAASNGISYLGAAGNIASFAGSAGLWGSAAAGPAVTSTFGAVASGAGYAGAGSTGLMGTAGATLAAIPGWGWAALAAAAVAAYIIGSDDGDAQRTGNWTGAFGQSTASTQNRWFGNDMIESGRQFSAELAASEQQIASLLKLSSDQTSQINAALGALSGKQYGFGMEHTDWLKSGAPQAIAADRLRVIAESLGISVEALAQKMIDAQKVIDLAPQKLQLEIDLMKAQGDAAGALAAERKRELDALDPTLRALKNQIYAAQDLATAANDVAAAANDAGDAIARLADLLSETQNAVNEQIGQSRSASQAARAAAESFKQIGVALADAVTKIRGGGKAGAAGRLDALFGTAMMGNAAALSALPQAGQDFLAASLASSRTSLDFARDQAKVVAMLSKAQIVSEGMVNWNEYQATLLEAQTGILESIRDQLALPSPDAAILTQQMEMLGTIADLLQDQTTQIVSGDGMQAVLMHDQTGKIILANALTVDQTGQVALGNSWLGTQTGAIVSAATVAQAQSGQIAGAVVGGNALTAQQLTQLAAVNAGQGIVQTLLNGQTAQIIGGNLVLKDQSGLIITSNAILQDQAGKLTLGNSLVGTQTAKIITGNATQDVIKNITEQNKAYPADQLAALIESGGLQSDSLQGILSANDTTVLLMRRLVDSIEQNIVQDEAEKAARIAAAAAAEAAVIAEREKALKISETTAAYKGQQAVSDVALATFKSTIAQTGVEQAVAQQQDITSGTAFGYKYFTYYPGQEAIIAATRDAQAAYGDAFAKAYDLYKAIPTYAVGTSFVPSTGPAILHRGERVMNSAANDELVTEIRLLRKEVASLQKNAARTADTLEAVSYGQRSFSTEAA